MFSWASFSIPIVSLGQTQVSTHALFHLPLRPLLFMSSKSWRSFSLCLTRRCLCPRYRFHEYVRFSVPKLPYMVDRGFCSSLLQVLETLAAMSLGHV